MTKSTFFFSMLSLGLGLAPNYAGASVPGLQVVYGSNGIQKLTYNGVVLKEQPGAPIDTFHIGHMKATDTQGNLLTGGQYDSGEVNNGKSWNPVTQTWTYNFTWGAIATQFWQTGDTLNMNVVISNSPNSGIIFDGATIYPLVLHFPTLPAGFKSGNMEQLSTNTTAPSVLVADYGTGEAAAVYADASKPLYSGFLPTGLPNAYTAIVSGTSIDGMAPIYPHNDRPIAPGQTDTFTVSLRFGPSGTPSSRLGADAYQNWARTWPPTLNWGDRNIIGTVHLASSPSANPGASDAYPNNPRRYFNDKNPVDLDIRTPVGIEQFQNKILQQAEINVQNLEKLKAQGAITWDIEGEQFPQDTSFVCEPDQVATAAPEMELPVVVATSPYKGMKLDDAYFKIIRDAGFRVGVCVRPQHFTLGSAGYSARQLVLPDAQIPAELTGKIKYAHDRWGATLFFINSAVKADGTALDAVVIKQIAAAFPDSLLIPDASTPKDYAYSAPFLNFTADGAMGTPADVYNYYPNAFSANLINDAELGELIQSMPQLTNSVKRGDVLMVHADEWQTQNSVAMEIYQNAYAPKPPATAPAPSPILILSPKADQKVSGMIMVKAEMAGTLGRAGAYLLVDGSEIGPTPQLSGPLSFFLNTSTLTDGSHSIQVWAQDADGNSFVSAPTFVTVTGGLATPPLPMPNPNN